MLVRLDKKIALLGAQYAVSIVLLLAFAFVGWCVVFSVIFLVMFVTLDVMPLLGF